MTAVGAAYRLGVTVELLYGYTSWRCRAKPRKLRTVQKNSKTCFDQAELDDFDKYLHEPWGEEGSNRVHVPRCIEDHLRAESRNQCTHCDSGIGVQTAHIDPWATSRSHHHHNLIRICSQCHIEHDVHKSLSTAKLREIKNIYIERSRAYLAQQMETKDTILSPPSPETTFVGRTEDLESLSEALVASRMVLVLGSGGIGKTELLLNVLAKNKTEQRVVWLELERYATVEGLIAALAVMLSDVVGGVGTTDAIARHLDALQACVVLDGVEQFAGPALDEFDDWLANFSKHAANSQFLVSSQIDLQRTKFDKKLVLSRLKPDASRNLLRTMVQDAASLDNNSEARLLSFADGHPLTLCLTATLVDHLGSGHAVMKQLDQHGARFVQIKKRTKHNRQTSLVRCLDLSYEMLEEDEQRLLYVLANCPGGMFSHQVELYAGKGAPLVLAGLRHSSLVQNKESEVPVDRWYVLSPIRSYARLRWGEDHAADARSLTEKLLMDFGMMAAVIEMQAEDPATIPHMLLRFSDELPNLLLIIDEAEAQQEHPNLSALAVGVCTALMRFFFVAQLPLQGVQLMERGAKIAMREGDWNGASGMIAQATALTQRSQNVRLAVHVESILDEFVPMLDSVEPKDSEAAGNVAMARGMLAEHRYDADTAVRYARNAIAEYEVVQCELAEQPNAKLNSTSIEDNRNHLSGAYQLLGNGLLDKHKPAEARTAYGKARKLMGGASVAVNEGQLLYQIGKCQHELGKYADATDYYSRAATYFQIVGMKEYLSNALGGLGNSLVEIDKDTPLPQLPVARVLLEGLEDAIKSVISCLSARPTPDKRESEWSIRKLFGTIVVLSLSDEAKRLDVAGQELMEWVNETFEETRHNGYEEIKVKWELMHILGLAALMISIASFEYRAEEGHVQDTDIDKLSLACCDQGPGYRLESYSFQWLSIYLRKKWAIKD